MTHASLPDHWQELIAGYALGDLSPDEAEEVRRLLEANPALHQEVTQLQETLALLPYDLADREPPLALRSNILTAAQTETSTIPAQTPQRTTHGIHPRWWSVGGAIAAVLIGALAIDNYQLRRQVTESEEIVALLQQPSTQLYTLQGTGAAIEASGSLVVNSDHDQVVILVKNLPELPQSQAYRLWAMPQEGATPVYCGQFNTTAEATTTTTWTPPEEECTAIAHQVLLTAESASDPPIPAGELVMQGVL
ncbi:MAG: anti-sigma factor [Leptolyngbyaceae cyanobacterium SL_7_1]|nr:anti-sigma factor [Leptolyngbyaceae cyanobacterium SL_7_1]